MDLLDLIRQTGFEPTKKAATNGGEYTSPCPGCGGSDRFIAWPHQPNKSGTEGSYWCRVCDKGGDIVQFCVDFLEMSYKEAFEACGIDPPEKKKPSFFGSTSFGKPAEQDRNANPTWQSLMKKLCDASHQALLQRPQAIDYLTNRGLPLDAIKRYHLGYLEHTTYYDKETLGLEKHGSVFLPKGLTIPTIENQQIIRLKIRQPQKLPKYIAVSGSHGGLNILKGDSEETVIVVESELDAYAIHHLVKDRATVIAVGSNSKHPDCMSHALLKACEKLVVICDNDTGGEAMKNKWKGLYSKAIACTAPMGKDIGEAFVMKVDVRSWINRIV